MEYLDFELRIGVRAGESYPVTVVQSPSGKPSAMLDLSLNDLNFKQHLQTIEQIRRTGVNARRADKSLRASSRHELSSTELHAMQEIGQQLFAAIMPKPIYNCYRRSRDEAKSNKKGLRLRLHIDAPELALLPWEFLFDDVEGHHIAPNRDTPLTRYLALEHRIESLNVSPPLRILGMIVSPRDQQTLDINQEKETLTAILSSFIESGMVELEWVSGQTVRDLDSKLSQHEWHIFHFVGHGRFDEKQGEGSILLADSRGDSHVLNRTQIGNIFSRCPTLRLVVLNACEGARASEHTLFSSTASVLVQRGIPAVISMQYAITDHAAIDFAQNFYDALARKLPVDAAITEARYQLSINQTAPTEWGTPVLYMRSPDGNLFAIDDHVKLDPLPPSYTYKKPLFVTETQSVWEKIIAYLSQLSRFIGEFNWYYRRETHSVN